MRQIIASDHSFVSRSLLVDEACELFREDPYKLERIEAIISGKVDEHGEENGRLAKIVVCDHLWPVTIRHRHNSSGLIELLHSLPCC